MTDNARTVWLTIIWLLFILIFVGLLTFAAWVN